ncbi:protein DETOXIFICATION 43-like isoform X4 [Camellia sinensis]|nr:protein DETOXIFICATION 43-like isoform X4 [Camellia sinensis]
MDAFQICLQAIIACAFAEKDYEKAKVVAARVLQFVAATQPINSLVFVFDGVNFGASDFIYSAYSMVLVSVVSIASLFLLWKSHVFVGIWFGLTIFMGLRAFYGILRV